VIIWALVATVLSLIAGYAAGAVLPSSTVAQSANVDTGGVVPVNHFGVPTLRAATNPTGACTSGTVTLALSTTAPTPVANLILSSTAGTCAAGNYAEVYNFSISVTTAGTAVSQTDVVTISSQLTGAANPTTTAEDSKITATAAAGTYTGFVDVYVDYGSPTAPAAGVALLDIVVS
jgi:hypothetical protein